MPRAAEVDSCSFSISPLRYETEVCVLSCVLSDRVTRQPDAPQARAVSRAFCAMSLFIDASYIKFADQD